MAEIKIEDIPMVNRKKYIYIVNKEIELNDFIAQEKQQSFLKGYFIGVAVTFSSLFFASAVAHICDNMTTKKLNN